MFAPSRFMAPPRPAFGRAAQHVAEEAKPIRSKAEARYQRAARTAAELLPELPGRGESIHALMLGTFDLMQVIVATMRLVPTCRHLRIATLCFSKRNAAEMFGMLETYPALRLTLLVSSFFKSHNAELFESFADDLADFTGLRHDGRRPEPLQGSGVRPGRRRWFDLRGFGQSPDEQEPRATCGNPRPAAPRLARGMD